MTEATSTRQMMVRCEDLMVTRSGTTVFDGLSIEIPVGDRVVMVGRSGSGKSTLLRVLSGLQSFEAGGISIGDRSFNADDIIPDDVWIRVGMVFQDRHLFPHLTLRENVTLAPRLVLKKGRSEADGDAERLLESVGMLTFADRYPAQVSGGQQQRVAIARELAMDRQLLLMDEPTSALDPGHSRELAELLAEIAGDELTIIAVTHDMKFVRELAHRVVLLGNGKVLEDAPPDQFFNAPKSPEAKEFVRDTV